MTGVRPGGLVIEAVVGSQHAETLYFAFDASTDPSPEYHAAEQNVPVSK